MFSEGLVSGSERDLSTPVDGDYCRLTVSGSFGLQRRASKEVRKLCLYVIIRGLPATNTDTYVSTWSLLPLKSRESLRLSLKLPRRVKVGEEWRCKG